MFQAPILGQGSLHRCDQNHKSPESDNKVMPLALGRLREERHRSLITEKKWEDEQEKKGEQEQGETQQVQKDEERDASLHPGRFSHQSQLKEKHTGPWLL